MLNSKLTYVSFLSLLMLFCQHINLQSYEAYHYKSRCNKWLSTLSSSTHLLYVENVFLSKIYDFLMISSAFGNEIADQEYQDLGKEAQVALGIPEKYQVTIKKFPAALCDFPVAAVAMPGAIYVNEERLKTETVGAKRCTLFHEAVHKKYNEGSCSIIVELISFFGTPFLMREFILSIKDDLSKWIYYPILMMSACGSLYLVGTSYAKFTEKRADIEGHFATSCSVCVQESAARRRKVAQQENRNFHDKGYLTPEGLEKIAQELKSQGKLCHYHSGH